MANDSDAIRHFEIPEFKSPEETANFLKRLQANYKEHGDVHDFMIWHSLSQWIYIVNHNYREEDRLRLVRFLKELQKNPEKQPAWESWRNAKITK